MPWQVWDATWASWSRSASLLASQSSTHSASQPVGCTERQNTAVWAGLHYPAPSIDSPCGIFPLWRGIICEDTSLMYNPPNTRKHVHFHTCMHRCNTFINGTHTLVPTLGKINSWGGGGGGWGGIWGLIFHFLTSVESLHDIEEYPR